MAGRMPNRVVARMEKELRAGKVLVDWGQNDRHKSTVAAYSLRAKLPWPTVSAPVTHEELTAAVDTGREDDLRPAPEAVLDRLCEAGDLFAPVLSLVQQLPAAVHGYA
jgi:bifunctional non-homologous end joining protein LigD